MWAKHKSYLERKYVGATEIALYSYHLIWKMCFEAGKKANKPRPSSPPSTGPQNKPLLLHKLSGEAKQETHPAVKSLSAAAAIFGPSAFEYH